MMDQSAPKSSSFTSFLPAIIAAIVAFIVYYLTSAPDITWAHNSQDSGDFAACAASHGIPHPTGYPSYIVLGSGFIEFMSWLTPGRAMVLFSVVTSALAVGLMARAAAFAIRLVISEDRLSDFAAGCWGALASIFVAFTPLLWSQSVVCEVYSLAIFLQSVFWLWFIVFLRKFAEGPIDKAKKNFIDLGLSYSLILTHHVSGGAIILPVIIIYLISRVWFSFKTLLKSLTWMLLWLILIYSFLPFISWMNPTLDWGNTETLHGFFRHITAWQYRNLVFGVHPDDFLIRLSSIPHAVFPDNISLITAIVGLIVLLWKPDRISRALAVGFIVYSVWIIAFACGYNVSDFTVFLYPLLPMLAIAIAVALASVSILIRKYWKPLTWILALAIIANLYGNARMLYHEMNCSQCRSAINFASRQMALMPDNALVISGSDGTLFSLIYATTCGISDPLTDQEFPPMPDVDVVATTWILNDWFRQNVHDRYRDKYLIIPDVDTDLPTTLSAFIDANLPNRPVYIDRNALEILRSRNFTFETRPVAGLMLIVPEK